MFIALPRYLLSGRDHTLGSLGLGANPDDDQTAGVGPAIALDHSRNDLALAGGELAVGALVLGVAESLQHHLACRRGGDPAEALWSVVPLADEIASLIGLTGDHPNDTGFPVDLDARIGLVTLGVPVGSQQRGLDRFEQFIDRDTPVHLDGMQSSHVDVHAPASVPRASPISEDWASSNSAGAGGENSTWTTAFTISASGISRTAQPRSSRITNATVPARISPTRPVSRDPSDNTSSTLRPRARRKCFSLVSGRSTPGELTSSR
ncbi:Uncharacterised protein [Mycobacterium tuberculosis]|nr:Uncharacterised protein [Mycobacterium tuberculosis]